MQIKAGIDTESQARSVWFLLGRLHIDVGLNWSRPFGARLRTGQVRRVWVGTEHCDRSFHWRAYLFMLGGGLFWLRKQN